MQLEWYGQSAFRLTDGVTTVFIDPFGDVSWLVGQGLRWDYRPITGVSADLLLVTHEHGDHNGVEAIGGDPVVLRSTAGTHESPIGEVVGIAAEHDKVAGTVNGAMTLFVFTFDGLRVAHLGDLGQTALRAEQLAALGQVDLLLVPVGDGPTIGAEQAATIAAQVGARLVVPHHYRTAYIDWLEPVDAMVERFARVHRAETPVVDLDALEDGDGPLLVLPAVP
jgi:L-ascorbate metabolism protein UlaG (beta-lactamase superfamily)